MARDPRERVTINLRGLGAAVQLRAAVERTTVAARARRAIAVMLDAPVTVLNDAKPGRHPRHAGAYHHRRRGTTADGDPGAGTDGRAAPGGDPIQSRSLASFASFMYEFSTSKG